MKINSNLVLALLLAMASAIAAALVVPYLLRAVGPSNKPLPPLPILMLGTGAQNGVLSFLMAWVGLRLAPRLGLGMPVLRDGARIHVLLAVTLGAAIAAIVLLLDRWLFLPHQPASLLAAARRAEGGWPALLASFYGGISEEIMVRLFLMTGIAYVLSKVMRVEPAIACALLVAAALFAAGHLPAAAKIAGLSCPVVTRVLALNGIAGIAFGAIYRRLGLEHAMLAHFASDLVLHGVPPFIR